MPSREAIWIEKLLFPFVYVAELDSIKITSKRASWGGAGEQKPP